LENKKIALVADYLPQPLLIEEGRKKIPSSLRKEIKLKIK
jgi:hypothetical protein